MGSSFQQFLTINLPVSNARKSFPPDKLLNGPIEIAPCVRVVSCITVLWMCVWRTNYVSTIAYAKQQIAGTLLLRHNSEYFIKYRNIILEKPTGGLKYRERQLDDICRWVCRDQVNGHDGCKTHYIEKARNTLYIEYGLGKAGYSSLAN